MEKQDLMIVSLPVLSHFQYIYFIILGSFFKFNIFKKVQANCSLTNFSKLVLEVSELLVTECLDRASVDHFGHMMMG